MTTEITVPTLGESITEATLSKWFKGVGDFVELDEAVCELETEKVTLEVPSPVSGTIENIAVKEGTDVLVGALLCTVAEGKAHASTQSKEAQGNKAKDEQKHTTEDKQEHTTEDKQRHIKKDEEKNIDKESTSRSQAVKSAPSARLQASALGVDIATVTPTGGLGNVTKQDVEKVHSAQKQATSPVTAPVAEALPPRPQDARGEEVVPMSKLRKVISKRLKAAQNTAAILTTFNEVDMTHLMELRAKYKEKFEKKHGTRLGFMSFFVKASVQALKEFPAVNAEIYGEDIIYKPYKDIGIAVGTPQGLVVPILRNAQDMSVTKIEEMIADFGVRAKKAQLTMEEMTGGSFTITNGGVFGSLLSTPIINPPQSAILGLHKIEKRPVVVDDAIVIRQMMYLALSYDHRIIDGREAVTFLLRIKELLESPERLLLEI